MIVNCRKCFAEVDLAEGHYVDPKDASIWCEACWIEREQERLRYQEKTVTGHHYSEPGSRG